MRKVLSAIIFTLLLLTGCFRYGGGEITGYPMAVENGFFWDKVWIKSTLESSDQDCLVIPKNSVLSDEIRQHARDQEKHTYRYSRHLATLTSNCFNDEITSYG